MKLGLDHISGGKEDLSEIFKAIRPQNILCDEVENAVWEKSFPQSSPEPEDETRARMVSYSNDIYRERILGGFTTLNEGAGSVTLRKVKRTVFYGSEQQDREERNEDFYIFGCVINGEIVANLRFIHSPQNNTWNLCDRVIDEKLRGGGVGTAFLQMAERCIQEYADNTQVPQRLTASNVAQKSVMLWLKRNGWNPIRWNEYRYAMAIHDHPSLVTKSGADNPYAKDWIYDKSFLTAFENQYGDIFKINDVMRRPYIYKAFLVPFEKFLIPKNDVVQRIQKEVTGDLGDIGA